MFLTTTKKNVITASLENGETGDFTNSVDLGKFFAENFAEFSLNCFRSSSLDFPTEEGWEHDWAADEMIDAAIHLARTIAERI